MDTPLALTPRYLQVLDAMNAGVEEWRVVNALRTAQSPRRICPMLEMGDFRVCQTLWTLVLLGAVQVSSAERVEPVTSAVSASAAVLQEELAPTEEVAIAEVEAEVEVEVVPEIAPAAPADRSEPSIAVLAEAAQTRRMSRQEVESALGIGHTAPTPAAPASSWVPQAGLDETIGRFNAMHQAIYRLVRAEIGAGAINFVRSCCAAPAAGGADPLQGATLRSDGSWDRQSLERAIHEQRIDDPWPVYRRVIDRELDLLRAHLGETKSARLRREIEEIEGAELPRPA
jgi:hypothetical protein